MFRLPACLPFIAALPRPPEHSLSRSTHLFLHKATNGSAEFLVLVERRYYSLVPRLDGGRVFELRWRSGGRGRRRRWWSPRAAHRNAASCGRSCTGSCGACTRRCLRLRKRNVL